LNNVIRRPQRELNPDGPAHRKLNGVIVTTPAADGRVKLGARVRPHLHSNVSICRRLDYQLLELK